MEPPGPGGWTITEDVSQGAVPSDRRAAAARRLSSGERQSALDRLCELAMALLQVGSAQVSVISDVQFVAGGAGAARESVGREGPARDSLCTVTMGYKTPLLVVDAATDPRVADLPPVLSG